MSWQPPSDRPSGWESPGGPQPPPPQGNWPPPPQWGPPPPPNSGNAIAALVLGIAGLTVCPFICSIIALALGYQARREIDRSGGAIGGRGLAVAGIVLGWVGIVFGVLMIILFGAAIVAGVEEGIDESGRDGDFY